MPELLPVFKALSDATRLRIVAILRAGRFNVNELAGVLEMGQSRVSRHLRILSEAGLVEARRDGSWVFYGLSRAWLDAPLLTRVAAELVSAEERERRAIDACIARRRERAESFFRRVAPSWDDRRDRAQGPSDHAPDLLAAVGSPATIVDLGTGTGFLLAALAKLATRVIGIDASADMLREARARVRRERIDNVDLRLGEVEHLPLRDGSADVMVANMILHHVTEPASALSEIARVLRPGGRLIVADFVRHDREEYRETLGDLWLGFEPAELIGWLRGLGYAVEGARTLSGTAISGRTDRPAVQLIIAKTIGEGSEYSEAAGVPAAVSGEGLQREHREPEESIDRSVY